MSIIDLNNEYRALHARLSHRTRARKHVYISGHRKQNKTSMSVTKPRPLMCEQTYLDILIDYVN